MKHGHQTEPKTQIREKGLQAQKKGLKTTFDHPARLDMPKKGLKTTFDHPAERR